MSLLALVIVLLVLAMICAGLLVCAAKRRAAALRRPLAVQAAEAMPMEESSEVEAFPPVPLYVDVAMGDAATGNMTAEESAAGAPCDAYADPVDGVPFVLGELVVPCRCGVGYRVESLEWLCENLGGRCVECGYALESRAAGVR